MEVDDPDEPVPGPGDPTQGEPNPDEDPEEEEPELDTTLLVGDSDEEEDSSSSSDDSDDDDDDPLIMPYAVEIPVSDKLVAWPPVEHEHMWASTRRLARDPAWTRTVVRDALRTFYSSQHPERDLEPNLFLTQDQIDMLVLQEEHGSGDHSVMAAAAANNHRKLVSLLNSYVRAYEEEANRVDDIITDALTTMALGCERR